MPYYLYILRTSSNTLYIGQTNNLEKRLKEHQTKGGKSAKYTRYFSNLELVYTEAFATRKEAVHREAQLKKWPRSQKDALIKRAISKNYSRDSFSVTSAYTDSIGAVALTWVSSQPAWFLIAPTRLKDCTKPDCLLKCSQSVVKDKTIGDAS